MNENAIMGLSLLIAFCFSVWVLMLSYWRAGGATTCSQLLW